MFTISANLTKRYEFLLSILYLTAKANLNRLYETLNLLKHVLPAESNVIPDVESITFSELQKKKIERSGHASTRLLQGNVG